MQKKFIIRPQNDGKIFGLKILKVYMSDEPLTKNRVENIEIKLSDCDGFTFTKDSRFEIKIRQVR